MKLIQDIQVTYSKQKGISIHRSASYVIARRGWVIKKDYQSHYIVISVFHLMKELFKDYILNNRK